jgi:hypothetical protein
MTRKTLLTASLILPLIAMSGVAYAGSPHDGSAVPARLLNKQTSQSVASKPYAQLVAPQQTSGSQSNFQTGPKLHYERR